MLLLLAEACTVRTPSPPELRDKLWSDANAVFQEHRAVLTDDARRELRDFIEQGAARLEAGHASQADVRFAEGNIRSLALDMVTDAERAGGSGSKGITEILGKHFQAVRNKVCPLYPFCQ